MAEAETQVQEDENVEVTLDQSNEPDEKNTEEVTVSSEDTSADSPASSDDELDNYSKGVQTY